MSRELAFTLSHRELNAPELDDAKLDLAGACIGLLMDAKWPDVLALGEERGEGDRPTFCATRQPISYDISTRSLQAGNIYNKATFQSAFAIRLIGPVDRAVSMKNLSVRYRSGREEKRGYEDFINSLEPPDILAALASAIRNLRRARLVVGT